MLAISEAFRYLAASTVIDSTLTGLQVEPPIRILFSVGLDGLVPSLAVSELAVATNQPRSVIVFEKVLDDKLILCFPVHAHMTGN